jgi:hypothetical protein
MPDLRESIKNVAEGAFEEDETLMGAGAPSVLFDDKEGNKDVSRQSVSSLFIF